MTLVSFPSQVKVMSGSHTQKYNIPEQQYRDPEDIGGGDNALFCMTNLTACYHDDINGRSALGNRKSVRFLQNQRSDGAWYICTLERWRGWNLPL